MARGEKGLKRVFTLVMNRVIILRSCGFLEILVSYIAWHGLKESVRWCGWQDGPIDLVLGEVPLEMEINVILFRVWSSCGDSCASICCDLKSSKLIFEISTLRKNIRPILSFSSRHLQFCRQQTVTIYSVAGLRKPHHSDICKRILQNGIRFIKCPHICPPRNNETRFYSDREAAELELSAWLFAHIPRCR